MSKADEMFEKLGYEKHENEFDEIIYINIEMDYIIKFDLYLKQVKTQLDEETDLALGITIQELQSINEKVKELGWI